ncbi:hypothetical protein GCM10007860_27350 [Chitiniphilus shinanonensis]|uniref:Uncharacterized protein n=1 Tax=Chitiniphilus shinanonensis TaxID=553088 RepID=A0ABQ6BV47_9NEIS|nr:hypothetical protein [Chitiniphilus shinanonensis]GLS05578.1 hypothetical protein GCM10007860_27350 [Chitiniphilus shinanonensis]
MFTCLNQSCGAQWKPEEVTIKNEGQGELFRCPLCGARNRVLRSVKPDGRVVYKQMRPGN